MAAEGDGNGFGAADEEGAHLPRCCSWFSVPFGMNSPHPKGWRGRGMRRQLLPEVSPRGPARCGSAGTRSDLDLCHLPFSPPPARGGGSALPCGIQVCPGRLRTEGGAHIGKSLPGCRFGELWSHVQGSVAIVTGYFRSLRWWFIIAAREAAARRERRGGRDPRPWEVQRNWDWGGGVSFLLSQGERDPWPWEVQKNWDLLGFFFFFLLAVPRGKRCVALGKFREIGMWIFFVHFAIPQSLKCFSSWKPHKPSGSRCDE